MPRHDDDAQRLRDKAERARVMADKMTDPVCRQIMLDVAVSYVVLAQSADEQVEPRAKN